MCGSSDKLFAEVEGIPICKACGFKTDIYYINASFRVKRRTYDLSATYDGYKIASLKFMEACNRLKLSGLEFLKLPADDEFFVVRSNTISKFDTVARKTKFDSLCDVCGFYRAVAGATPAYIMERPETDFSRTDIVFGSGNCRSPLIIATEYAKNALRKERLKGLEFCAVMHNNSHHSQP
jgi:hypothetical protein